MIVLGIDGGFASMGLAAVELLPDNERVIKAWVVCTELSAKKRGVKAGDDTCRRARELAFAVGRAVDAYDPIAIAIESPSWPRNCGVAAKMGVAFGVVFALSETHRLPLVMASPQEVKRAVCGAKTASKDEIIHAIEMRYPEIGWPKRTTLWEHAADAVGVVVACLDSPALQMARQLFGKTERFTMDEIAEMTSDERADLK